jgi:hypothetical protein
MNLEAGDPAHARVRQLLERLLKVWETAAVKQKPNRACLSGLPLDEPALLQREEHSMNRGRRDLEIVAEVRFRWCPTVDLRVVVDEREILPLLGGIPGTLDGKREQQGSDKVFVRIGFLDLAKPIGEVVQPGLEPGIRAVVGLGRQMTKEIIEVVEGEVDRGRRSFGRRDPDATLELGIDERMLNDQVALASTEPDRDTLSRLKSLRLPQRLPFMRSNGWPLTCGRA